MIKRITQKLAFKLLIPIISVIIIIAVVFYLVINMQTAQTTTKLYEKANLFTSILGANLSKILEDNLKACNNLQKAVETLEEINSAVTSITVVGKDMIILAQSEEQDIWKPADEQYQPIVTEIITTKISKSIVHNDAGKEFVLHFLPIPDYNDKDKINGVLIVDVLFPSQQGQIMSNLRANARAYFREEAAQYAEQLSSKLNEFIKEAQRNFNYLEKLFNNMAGDNDIDDVQLHLKDLGVVISGGQNKARFIADFSSSDYKDFPANKKTQVRELPGGTQIEFTSPLLIDNDKRQEVAGNISIVFSLTTTRTAIKEMHKNIFKMAFAIIVSFCLLIGLFFRQKILHPIKNLIDLTADIKKGDFNRRIPVNTQDELGELTSSFNNMLDELEKSKREIELWNVRLQDEIARVSEELQDKQSQLLKSEKLASLGVLSSGIAHEINNPLGVILGHSQLLLKDLKEKKGLDTSKETKDLLETIERYSKRCSHIVKSLLQFTHKREFQFEEIDVLLALENSLMFTGERISQKGIEVTRHFSPKLPRLTADAIQLEQVFINLLLNAEQSISKKGKIIITTNLDKNIHKKNMVKIVFEDNGEGVTEEDLSKIFDPFFTTKDPGEGVGLGLSISYGIIKAHHGEITIRSQKNRGTTVTIQLPIKKEAG